MNGSPSGADRLTGFASQTRLKEFVSNKLSDRIKNRLPCCQAQPHPDADPQRSRPSRVAYAALVAFWLRRMYYYQWR